jgi:hypothetical protein
MEDAQVIEKPAGHQGMEVRVEIDQVLAEGVDDHDDRWDAFAQAQRGSEILGEATRERSGRGP